MPTILDEIVETKRAEVQTAKRERPVEALRSVIEAASPPRDFLAALRRPPPFGIHLIAEVKKASPSAGVIVEHFDPAAIARTYHQHAATAISVLTDEPYFQGRLAFIDVVKQVVPLPVLRKDFIIDEYQLYESRAAGADAVLLIADVLPADQIATLHALASKLRLAVLVEVHSEPKLMSVLDTLGPPDGVSYILGINNRDLSVQRTDLSTTDRLAKELPNGSLFVSESGIATRRDVLTVQTAGARAILIGEALLKAADPGRLMDELLGQSR